MPFREDGGIIIDGRQVASTLQCCHCGNHFVTVKGSGIIRGYCYACSDVTCGAVACMTHYPFEKKLDDIESGKLIIL
jgi:hypothetical protein